MSSAIKPMLAATWGEDVHEVKFPILLSPKVDGIRALIKNGVVQARSGDPIKHPLVQKMFGLPELEGLDGELAIGPLTARDLMQRTGAVNGFKVRIDPDLLTFNVFDKYDCPKKYGNRLIEAIGQVEAAALKGVSVLPHKLARSKEDFEAAEESYVDAGFEGMMANVIDAPYKFGGRCGKTQPWLVKIKRFTDDEALVLGLIEQQHNANEQLRDELGHAYRSTSKAGMVGAKTLGAMRVRVLTGVFKGVEFELGAGAMDHKLRKAVWNDPLRAMGKHVTFKHFAVVGAKSAPRFPTWKAFRTPGT